MIKSLQTKEMNPLHNINIVTSQSYSFPRVMYGSESWIIKKAEYQKTDAFELWC